VALVLLLGAFVTLSVSRRSSYVEVKGHVYQEFDATGRGPVGPVSGAKVSNDWDSTTATTDSLGEFHLRVRRVAEDEWVKFTARAGEEAGCQQVLSPLTQGMVEIFLKESPQGPGRCQPH
jgi:hypothetical protein